MHHPLLTTLTALIVSPVGTPARAQETSSDTLLTVNHYMDFERVSDPQLSPDGSLVVYARSHVNKMEDKWDSELWIMNADGSRQRFLTKGSTPRWSPDGSRIAYLAEGDPMGTQIFVRWMDAEGATSQITRVDETPGSFRWAPDAKSIAFVMLVPEKETWNISMPAPPEDAKWTEPPRMVSTLHYRQDRRGFMKQGHTHIFVVPANGGTPRQITYGSWNVGPRFSGLAFGAGVDWTPDGRTIVFDGLMEENPDEHYGESAIYKVDVSSGKISQLTRERGNWAGPVVSPDGRRVAFAGYPARYIEQTYHTTELFAIGIDGSEMRKISGALDRDVGQLFWAGDSKGVYFTAGIAGSSNVHYASTDGKVRHMTQGTHMLSLASVNPNGFAVGTLTSPQKPGDIVSVDLRNHKRVEQLTRVNDDVLGNKRLGDVEEIWYTSTGGAKIQGWIVKPPSFDATKTYPLVLHIHGGPHGMYNVGFSYAYQNYAANGYVVLYTNPRGSTGYGTDFGNAIDDAYPSVDHEDLMAGVDSLVDRGYVDPNRLYVTGCSGGGVLSSWAVGHTDRFAAAAVRCPVIDWISFAGTTDIIQWGYHRFGGYFWDDPTKWLEHSPLMHVGKVKTPVLLMTGELDLRTPISQTEEYYSALKTLGVPTVMLRFNNEYHGTSRTPSNFMRTQLYMLDWFKKYTKKKAVSRRR
ncbi:MAG: S9 family peptidase [Gemmatimonadales bacterium]